MQKSRLHFLCLSHSCDTTPTQPLRASSRPLTLTILMHENNILELQQTRKIELETLHINCNCLSLLPNKDTILWLPALLELSSLPLSANNNPTKSTRLVESANVPIATSTLKLVLRHGTRGDGQHLFFLHEQLHTFTTTSVPLHHGRSIPP